MRSSEVIINTGSWPDAFGYKVLLQIAYIFQVDFALVMESEDLYNNINKDLPFLQVGYLPPCNGVRI